MPSLYKTQFKVDEVRPPDFYKEFASFAGADIHIWISIPDGIGKARWKELAECSTLSISGYRGRTPVRSFGKKDVSGWTAGYKSIAGSFITTIVRQQALVDLLSIKIDSADTFDVSVIRNSKIDELPPFNIICIYNNEYGQKAFSIVRGAQIINEGQVMSIEDLFTETTFSYVARDYDPITILDDNFDIKDNNQLHEIITQLLDAGNITVEDIPWSSKFKQKILRTQSQNLLGK